MLSKKPTKKAAKKQPKALASTKFLSDKMKSQKPLVIRSRKATIGSRKKIIC